jgi:hypothetical protein
VVRPAEAERRVRPRAVCRRAGEDVLIAVRGLALDAARLLEAAVPRLDRAGLGRRRAVASLPHRRTRAYCALQRLCCRAGACGCSSWSSVAHGARSVARRAGGRCRAAGSTGKAVRGGCLLRSLPAVVVSLAGGEPFGRSQRKLLTRASMRASTAQKSVARPLHSSLRRLGRCVSVWKLEMKRAAGGGVYTHGYMLQLYE